jgi:hypothetical protein
MAIPCRSMPPCRPFLIISPTKSDSTVNAPALGHYRLKVDILQNGVRLEQLEAQMARIASLDTSERRYSPFGMCALGEFELMKLAGVKSYRGDSASWGRTVEPLPGVFYPDRPDVGAVRTWRR